MPAGQHLRWFVPRTLGFPKEGFDIYRIPYGQWRELHEANGFQSFADFRAGFSAGGPPTDPGLTNWSGRDRSFPVHTDLDLVFRRETEVELDSQGSIRLIDRGGALSFLLRFHTPVLYVSLQMSTSGAAPTQPVITGFHYSARIVEVPLEEQVEIEKAGITDLLVPLAFNRLRQITFVSETDVIELVNLKKLGQHLVTLQLPRSEAGAYELLRPDVEAGIRNRMLDTSSMNTVRSQYPSNSIHELVGNLATTLTNPVAVKTTAGTVDQMPVDVRVQDYIHLASLDPNIARMLASYWVDREPGDFLYLIRARYDKVAKKAIYGFSFTLNAARPPEIPLPVELQQLPGIDYRGDSPFGRVGLAWVRESGDYRNPARPVFADVDRTIDGVRENLTKQYPLLIDSRSKHCFRDNPPVNVKVAYHITPVDIFGRSGPAVDTSPLDVHDLAAPVPPKNIRAVLEQRGFPWQKPAERKEPDIKQGMLRATCEFGEAQRLMSPDATTVRWLWYAGTLAPTMSQPSAWNELVCTDLPTPLAGNVDWSQGGSPVEFVLPVAEVRNINSRLIELLIDRPLLEPGLFDGYALVTGTGYDIVAGTHAGIGFSDDSSDRRLQTARLVVERSPVTQAIQAGDSIRLVHPLAASTEPDLQRWLHSPEAAQLEALHGTSSLVRVTLSSISGNGQVQATGGEVAIDCDYQSIPATGSSPARVQPVNRSSVPNAHHRVLLGRLVSDVQTGQANSAEATYLLRLKPADFIYVLLASRQAQPITSTARFHPPLVLPQKAVGLNGETGDIFIQMQATQRFATLWLSASTLDRGGRESTQVAPPFEMRVINPPPVVWPAAPYPQREGIQALFGLAAPPDHQGRSNVRVAWDALDSGGVRYELGRALDKSIVSSDRDRWMRGDSTDHFAGLGIITSPEIHGMLWGGLQIDPSSRTFRVSLKTLDPQDLDRLMAATGRIKITHSFDSGAQALYHRLLKVALAPNGNVTLLCQPFFELTPASIGHVNDDAPFVAQSAPDYSTVLADENRLRQLADVSFTGGELQGEGRNESAFGVVTGMPIAATDFVDTIPGTGSNGYYYKVRAVFPNEMRSAWSSASVAFRQLDLSPADPPELVRLRRGRDSLTLVLMRPQGRGVLGVRLLTGSGPESLSEVATYTFSPQADEMPLQPARIWPTGSLVDLQPAIRGVQLLLDALPQLLGIYDLSVDRQSPPPEENLLTAASSAELVGNIVKVLPSPPPGRPVAVQIELENGPQWLTEIPQWVEIVLQSPPHESELYLQTVKEIEYQGAAIHRDSQPIPVGGAS